MLDRQLGAPVRHRLRQPPRHARVAIEPGHLLHARAAPAAAHTSQLHSQPHRAPEHWQVPDAALDPLVQSIGSLAATPAAKPLQIVRMQLHPNRCFVSLQVGHPKSLPERKTGFILLHLSGALCTLMIGRTTIMAESAPLSSFAEPRTSAMNQKKGPAHDGRPF